MLVLLNEVAVWQLDLSETVVVTLQGDNYGTLELDNLEQLRDDLDTAQILINPKDRIVVDLSGVSMIGSTFIRELYRWIGTLLCRPSNIVICGDRTGVLKVCGADRWLTLRDDLAEVLQVAPLSRTIEVTTGGHLVLASC
jgi:anti-anti-sigma regulatory factor